MNAVAVADAQSARLCLKGARTQVLTFAASAHYCRQKPNARPYVRFGDHRQRCKCCGKNTDITSGSSSFHSPTSRPKCNQKRQVRGKAVQFHFMRRNCRFLLAVRCRHSLESLIVDCLVNRQFDGRCKGSFDGSKKSVVLPRIAQKLGGNEGKSGLRAIECSVLLCCRVVGQ